ncbi:P-loop NTPase family protein [Anaeromicropila populeti]|uniref:Pilus assembly protein CpaF n=1 Tax=Anaeromicropila populeti TaxID=37658 RepID=A0A1I6JDA4_9FIRM|nr:ATPase, T2SS/T4P/T4SS family [Anaeromicropila populeti]SFR76937.1 pilus assembly protein CpaF [Anaeromicropila populeti]
MYIRRKEKKCMEISELTIENLVREVGCAFAAMLRDNPYEIVRNKLELSLRVKFKSELRSALKACSVGDIQAKKYIKEHIKELLVQRFSIQEHNIEKLIPFTYEERLSVQEKFDILLYMYSKKHGIKAFEELLVAYNLDCPKRDELGESFYEITEDEIAEVYACEGFIQLNFMDKLELLAQRIYQEYKGNGVLDNLREMKIDGLSGGVSGRAFHESIWVFYMGKSIHLSFLKFSSQTEFIRVCKNIYRYNQPGQLSQMKGYIVNDMMDGSRVSVARPPFCESWVFFIRKFDVPENLCLESLLKDRNNCLPIALLQWIIKGNQVTAITGEQGSGKTTLLMAVVRYIKPSFNIRVQELAFELNLRRLYPQRNVVTFRETANISGQEGLDFQKKSDGAVNILGEVASHDVASWLIQISQVASQFTLFTHHAKTTEDLILSLRNSLLQAGGFSNEIVAKEQVINAIRFDVHMKKELNGHRYIERISEIIDYSKIEKNGVNSAKVNYELRNIIVCEDGEYKMRNRMSEQSKQLILSQLSREEKALFLREIMEWEESFEKKL